MRLKNCKIVLIAALSFAGCAGKPPAMERKVMLYGGVPERQEMCGVTPDTLTAFVERFAKHQRTKAYAGKYIKKALAAGVKCIPANAPEFASMVGVPADDFRVIMQYQEALLYKCRKWAD